MCKNYYSSETSVRLFINTGISYNFKITTDYSSQIDSLFLDVPLCVGVDTRFIEWFSIYSGVDFLYGLHSLKETIDSETYIFYLHNMFIRIPFIIKFYPFIYKDQAYLNFYLGLGVFAHFWPLNCYYIIPENNAILLGNSYQPSHKKMPPGNIYTPANIGFKFSIGNHFPVSYRTLFGIELYFNYLFIPYVNGYYFNQNYNRGNAVILEFNASVGILISIGINLRGE